MTEILVERYSEFPDLDAYLNGYAIVGDALARLEVPSHILFSLDDPIIPARDLARSRADARSSRSRRSRMAATAASWIA